MLPIIPIMHCFNDAYVIPAAVSFNSMLKRASKKYFYQLYVLHTDILPEHQDKLTKIVAQYENAALNFVDMNGKFEDLFIKTRAKGHYSKEMYYKFLPPELFPQYDKIIITDVDVVFLGDIAEDFISFDSDSDDYLAAVRGGFFKRAAGEKNIDLYAKEFSTEERAKLQYCGGYYIYNLRKMRKDNCQQKFIEWISDNYYRAKCPEQDAISLVCYPYIKELRPNALICACSYKGYPDNCDLSEEAIAALKNPVQLHYSGAEKPWNHPGIIKSDIWFDEILKTPFADEFLSKLDEQVNGPKIKRKVLYSFKVPFRKRKLLLVKEWMSH